MFTTPRGELKILLCLTDWYLYTDHSIDCENGHKIYRDHINTLLK